MIYKNKNYYKFDTIGPFGIVFLRELNRHDFNSPHKMMEAACHCGNIFTVRTSYVLAGRQKSCGCLNNFCNGKNPNKSKQLFNPKPVKKTMPPSNCPWFNLTKTKLIT